ncbi:unnamed protein product [Laminaria digitata]
MPGRQNRRITRHAGTTLYSWRGQGFGREGRGARELAPPPTNQPTPLCVAFFFAFLGREGVPMPFALLHAAGTPYFAPTAGLKLFYWVVSGPVGDSTAPHHLPPPRTI